MDAMEIANKALLNNLSYDTLIAYINGLNADGRLSDEDYNKIIMYILANGNLENAPRDLIQIRRGNQADIPMLAQGELGFALDSRELYIGGLNGNVKLTDLGNINPNMINALRPPAGLQPVVLNGPDAGPALNAMVNYLSAQGGGTIVLPAGTINVSTTINVKPYISFVGANKDATIIKYNWSGNCFYYLGTMQGEPFYNVLKDFTIYGNDSATSFGVHTMNASGLAFDSLHVRNLGIGINVNSGNQFLVHNCTISFCTSGLRLGGDREGIIGGADYADGLTLLNTAFSENMIGLDHRGSEASSTGFIGGCDFFGTQRMTTGVWLSGTKGITLSGNWWETSDKCENIRITNIDAGGVDRGTPYATVIEGNYMLHGNHSVLITIGAATFIAGNYFAHYKTSAIAQGPFSTLEIGPNVYENAQAGSVHATASQPGYIIWNDPPNVDIPNLPRQRTGGTCDFIAYDNENGQCTVAFMNAVQNWNKVAVVATVQATDLTTYTQAPIVTWAKTADNLVRIKIKGQTTGRISYELVEYA